MKKKKRKRKEYKWIGHMSLRGSLEKETRDGKIKEEIERERKREARKDDAGGNVGRMM